MKRTKQQIGEAICRWSAYLLENKMATQEEIDNILDESVFKRAKAAVKGGLSRVGSGIASTAKKFGRAIHDEFAANPGVKELMNNIKELISDKGYDAEDIKFYVFVKALKQTFPVADFKLSKNRQTLVLQFKDKSTKPKTYEELHDFLRKSGFDGKKVKISDYVDSLAVGQLEDDIVLESVKEADTERIAKVVSALGWSAKHALTQKSLQKIAALFGIKGDNATADVKEVVKEYFDTKSSSDDESEEKNPKDSGKSSDDDSSSDEFEPDFEKSDDNKVNDMLLKTKTGSIGVMSCPFKEIRVQSNKIGVIFGDKPKNDERKKSMKDLVS